MVILIIAAIMLGFFLWLLFVPIRMHVDTYEDDYRISLKGVFKLWYVPGDKWEIRGNLIFVPFRFRGFEAINNKRDQNEGKKEKPKRKKKKRSAGFNISEIPVYSRYFRQLLSSFRIRRLYVQLDTGDVIINAYLYPLALVYKTEKIDVNINFDDDLGLILIIENRLWNVLGIGTRYLFRKYIF